MAKVSEHRFDGRVAVVTGAGAGLGRQHALELARRGARVVVNDVAKSPNGTPIAEKTAAELRARGAEAFADTASVADEAAVEAMIERAVHAFGTVDILVNNAGNAITKPTWNLPTADMR